MPNFLNERHSTIASGAYLHLYLLELAQDGGEKL